jgi:photosystem II stability/assembly factor-like uncharacterized protein
VNVLRLLLVSTAIAACGGSPQPRSEPAPADTAAPTAAPTTAPTTEPATEPAATPGSAANAYIGSIAVDPRGGAVYLGTAAGLFRVDKPGATPRRIVGKLAASGGTGEISSNLFVRTAGPGALLASGHPERGPLPENLGLIRSVDGGKTWSPVAQLGDADFHLLDLSRRRVVAVEADESAVQVSDDGGRTFADRAPPAAPVDLALDPHDVARMAVSTEQGVFTSTDDGRSWRPRDAPAGARLAWDAKGALYAADRRGKLTVSGDGGQTWAARGSIGVPPNVLVVAAEGKLYAAVPNGEVRYSTDGGRNWKRYARLV